MVDRQDQEQKPVLYGHRDNGSSKKADKGIRRAWLPGPGREEPAANEDGLDGERAIRTRRRAGSTSEKGRRRWRKMQQTEEKERHPLQRRWKSPREGPGGRQRPFVWP